MDDERFVLEVMSQMLTMLGFSAVTAPSGDQALEVVREALGSGRKIDIAILDLTVSGGRGGKEIVEPEGSLSHFQLIVSSGYSNDEVMAHPTRYGFAGRLSKPYISYVSRVLGSLVARRG